MLNAITEFFKPIAAHVQNYFLIIGLPLIAIGVIGSFLRKKD